MSCESFASLWKRAQRKADSPIRSKERATYRAIETWAKSEPPRRDSGECACGRQDRWRCWASINRALVLGQRRIW